MGGRSGPRTTVQHQPDTRVDSNNSNNNTHTNANSGGSGGSGSGGSRGRLIPVCRCDVCVSERRHQQQMRAAASAQQTDLFRRGEDDVPVHQHCIRFSNKHFQSGDAERCCLFHSY
nr:hypothetical protein BaRGS_006139 [Batillaria attramentaria]